MPLGGLTLWSKELFVSSDEIKSRIQTTVGNLISVQVKNLVLLSISCCKEQKDFLDL